MKLSSEQEKLIADYFQDKPVLKAYIFGSYSRDEADENSDIDIMIELDPKKPIGLEYVQYILDLGKLFSKKIDLVTYKLALRNLSNNAKKTLLKMSESPILDRISILNKIRA